MKKLETYKTTLIIRTETEERSVSLNTSIARGWTELSDVIAKEKSDAQDASLLARRDRGLAGGLWLTKQAENAKLYIDAIQTAITPSEYHKIEDIIEYIDLNGLRAIAVEIINRYTAYYDSQTKEFAE